ncbi:MAG: type II toxin-antitoxin system VapC family toxin [Spirochaetaceae bacterium]|nr:MAG: type II toxin-antitoxin system VapC family toxin [Spirochaetaceae bacterium]
MSVLDDQRLLLDTHVLFWLLTGAAELSSADIRTAIERASEREALFISAISAWEIAAMEGQGVLRFSITPHEWLTQATTTPGIRTLDVDPSIAAEAASLPNPFPGDFIDRALVATARRLNCVLLTADPGLLAYADRGYLRATGIG